jgi:hypothetical protein
MKPEMAQDTNEEEIHINLRRLKLSGVLLKLNRHASVLRLDSLQVVN